MTTPAPARRRCRVTRAIGARAKRPSFGRRRVRPGGNACARARTHARGRQRMRLGDNVCARATTGGTWEGCFLTNTVLLRRRLRPGDDACVRATTYVCACATTGAVREGCFFTNTPNFNARATTSAFGRQTPASGRRRPHARGRQRVRLADNVCARATTLPHGRGVFSQTPQTSTLGRRRLHPGDNGCARATTSALARRRLDPIVLTLAFFFAFAIQTKLFHYLFSRITQIVLKMVIQSYFY